MTTPSVLHFRDVGIGDVPTVGGKGASLGELLRAGIRVPPGFAVTTAAFRQTVEHLTVHGEPIPVRVAALDPTDADGLAAATAEIRAVLESAPPPDDVAEAVAAAYAALCEECGDPSLPVAVRSSATSEDSAEASFAGLQDTYLWIRGADSVLEHVRRCWASLYSVESVTYRLRRGIPETDLGMAIDASWGLGSAVVSGDVTPDSYVVSKVTGEMKRTVATKTRWHRPDPSGYGVVETDVPAGLQDQPSISDDEIAELVAVARQVEAHYGCPQDIEWAVAEAGASGENVFLLQSRPETVWAEKDRDRKAAPSVPTRRYADELDRSKLHDEVLTEE